MTFEHFSISVPSSVSIVADKCYKNNHIVFLFTTLKTSSAINNTQILYLPFTTQLNGIVINIPASSKGKWNIANEFVYGYINYEAIFAITTTPTLWLHLSLVVFI